MTDPAESPRLRLHLGELFWGLGFLAAFFTIHVKLLPGITGEYQPFGMLLIGLLAVAARPRLSPRFGVALMAFAVALAVPVCWHLSKGSLDRSALIRCVAGLAFLGCAPATLAVVPLWAFRAVIGIHVAMAVCGLLWPAPLVALITFLGIRGADYYGGWNAYLASEPSYAVLNLCGVMVLQLLKQAACGSRPAPGWLLVAAAVLMLTKAVTGFAFGLMFLAGFALHFLDVRRLLRLAGVLAIAAILTILVFKKTSRLEGTRLNAAFLAVVEAVEERSVERLLSLESSGAWRFFANYGGIRAGFVYPMGIGNIGLHNVMFDVVPPDWVRIIEVSLRYSGFEDNFNAQVPLANIALFGGLLPAAVLLTLFGFALWRAFQLLDKSARWVVVCYLLVGLLWQSALTAPGLWLALGAALITPVRPVLQRKKRYY
jgi:hypothetical protein